MSQFLNRLLMSTSVAALMITSDAGGGDAYTVNGFSPPVVADFAGILNSGTEYYRVGGSDSTFDDMWTFSRAGNATMVDSDGLVKWAPHNLALNSASPATQSITVVSGADYTVEITGTGSVTLSNAGSGTVTAGSPVEITASTTTLTLTVTGSPTTMWCYRSDLGGMANNPNTGTSYVATSGSIVYQARRNHYRWNGSSYVNKGILLESEARTNLITQSDVMSGWTTSNMTVAKNQTGADGVANSAHSLTATSGSATVLTTITAASNPHVYSALVKRITGTGTIEMTVNNGSTWVDVTSLINTSEFIQVGTGAGVTVTNPTVGFRITTSGDAIAVQFNQLEQTSGRFSSPIPTSGSTVTRAAEELLLNTSGHPINGTDFSWHIKGTLNYQTNNNEVFSIQNNTSNYTLARFATDGDLDVFNFTSAGDSNDETTTFAAVNLSAGDVFDYSIASRVDSGVEANAALNGTAGTAGSYGTTPNFTAATAYLDGRPFSRPPMHNVELLRIWPTADIGDTGIESATS